MNKYTKTEKPWDVAKATRDAIVGVAASMRMLKKSTADLAQTAEKKWQESKPSQRHAKDVLKKAAGQVVGLGKDVGKGIKQGIAHVHKGKKR